MKNDKTALIDGDLFIYRLTSASETEIDWGNDLWTLHSDSRSIKTLFDSEMDQIMSKLRCSKLIVALSDGSNFRKKLDPGYKSHRKGRKPLAYGGIRDYVYHKYKVAIMPHLEADDVLGILSATTKRSIIVSWDKDMGQVPGHHYDPLQNVTRIVTPEGGWMYFLTQVLTGDKTDGYAGLPGCGPVKAEKILSVSPTWQAVLEAYASSGYDETYALRQARLAYILKRKEEYCTKTNTVNLWTPV